MKYDCNAFLQRLNDIGMLRSEFPFSIINIQLKSELTIKYPLSCILIHNHQAAFEELGQFELWLYIF